MEETDWLGGQLTAQGVSALDEHEHIESFGGTRSYYEFRNAIRTHYGQQNPGNCWVTRLAFEPRVARRSDAHDIEDLAGDRQAAIGGRRPCQGRASSS